MPGRAERGASRRRYQSIDFCAALRQKHPLKFLPARRRKHHGAAVFLASRAADYVQGHVLAVDCGWLGR